MDTLIVTLLISFILVVLALAALAIKWVLTGKSDLRAGSCGRYPSKQKDQECGTNETCPLCKKQEKDDHVSQK